MFFGPHNMKMSHHFFSLWYPLKLGTFLISEDPPPNFELFPTETWDFFDFLTTHLFGLIPKFCCFFDWKASLMHSHINYSKRVIIDLENIAILMKNNSTKQKIKISLKIKSCLFVYWVCNVKG